MNFELHSEFKPTGDQPQAIKQLANGILALNENRLFKTNYKISL